MKLCGQVGFDLQPFQRRIVRMVLEAQREALILLPPGNGKTSLQALVALHGPQSQVGRAQSDAEWKEQPPDGTPHAPGFFESTASAFTRKQKRLQTVGCAEERPHRLDPQNIG
jgi:hypothetical protein